MGKAPRARAAAWRIDERAIMSPSGSRLPEEPSGPSSSSVTRLSDPAGLIRGFASPPHGGFAFIGSGCPIRFCGHLGEYKSGASRIGPGGSTEGLDSSRVVPMTGDPHPRPGPWRDTLAHRAATLRRDREDPGPDAAP